MVQNSVVSDAGDTASHWEEAGTRQALSAAWTRTASTCVRETVVICAAGHTLTCVSVSKAERRRNAHQLANSDSLWLGVL